MNTEYGHHFYETTSRLLAHSSALKILAGFRDWVPKELQRVGCVELLNTVQKRVRPKLHCFGGIHEGTGHELFTLNRYLMGDPVQFKNQDQRITDPIMIPTI